MKCPDCQSELIKGAGSWLCAECGYTAKHDPLPAEASPQITKRADAPAINPQEIIPAAPVAPVPAPSPAPPSVTAPAVSVRTLDVPPTPKKLRWGMIAAFGSLGLFTLLGGGVAYAVVIQPQQALPGYLKKLTDAKTAKFSSTGSYGGQGYSVELSADGKYTIKDPKDPRLSTTVGLKMKSTESSGALSSLSGGIDGEVMTTIDKTYFKITNSGLLQSFIGSALSKDWYYYEHSPEAESKQCLEDRKSGSVFGMNMMTAVPVKNAKRVGFMERVNGKLTTHYSGEIDFSKLQKVIDAANKELSADCQITFSTDDYKNQKISYDLWTGIGFDRLKIVSTSGDSDGRLQMIIDSSEYNKDIKIEKPKNAKDISEAFKPSAATSAGAADSQRMADIRMLQVDLEMYASNNRGKYPSKLVDLTKGEYAASDSIPTDPKNRSPYVYTYLPSTDLRGYTLTACMEVAGNTANTIAPIKPCNTRSYRVSNTD